MNGGISPKVKVLSDEVIDKVIDEGMEILEEIGVFIEDEEARKILVESGAKYDSDNKRVYIPRDMVEKSIEYAPSKIEMYNALGEKVVVLEGDNIHFDPGSSAINILDSQGVIRKPVTEDFICLATLVENLSGYASQSTSFICYDVPEEMQDSYRLYLALRHCSKPVVTGLFRRESFNVMVDMLLAVRGSREALERKPLAIFDACPSPPLKWSSLTAHSLVECAKYGIPSEMVSMPLAGATAPVTLLGAVVQHCAESLAGLTIAQMTKKGSPIIWGGSPSIFDMRKGTTPMGAIETMMIDLAYVEVGKRLNLPTHAYIGLSDAKDLDYQAGAETSMGMLLASLSGINMVSGGGMLDYESLFSLEKLVADEDIIKLALRLKRGIQPREIPFALPLLKEYERSKSFISSPHTLKWFKEEVVYPSSVIERASLGEWKRKGEKTLWQRAKERVRKVLDKGKKYTPPKDVEKELTNIMEKEAEKYNLNSLP